QSRANGSRDKTAIKQRPSTCTAGHAPPITRRRRRSGKLGKELIARKDGNCEVIRRSRSCSKIYAIYRASRLCLNSQLDWPRGQNARMLQAISCRKRERRGRSTNKG